MNNEILQIHLNSSMADKYNSNTTSDCDFFLPLIEVPQQHTIYLSVQHAIIPYTFYNINTSNNLISYSYNDIVFNLIIPIGNYDAYSLLNVLKAGFTTNMTVSYNIITNKYSFTHNAYEFIILGTSTGLNLIGFNNGVNAYSINKTLTSLNSINLQSKHCICIQSNLNTGSINNTHKNESNIICSIPIDKPPFSMITYQNHNNLKYNLFNTSIRNLNLRLTDQNNNLIDLNGCHWSISIQIEVVKFV